MTGESGYSSKHGLPVVESSFRLGVLIFGITIGIRYCHLL